MLCPIVDANKPDALIIGQAGEIIRRGGLVAFPTETVYGLGADALNEEAVARIYKAKGRPTDNPLIWHINDVGELEKITQLTTKTSSVIERLAKAFWPGPMTLVLNCKYEINGATVNTIGKRSTIAVRVPSHPVARALIAASERIIAAPSANISGKPSPTQAHHVLEDFSSSNDVEMVLDGGATQSGLESTVLDLHQDGEITLLRPGAITREMLMDVIGNVSEFLGSTEGTPLAPGMKYRHYAPIAPLILITGYPEAVAREIYKRSREITSQKVGILATTQTLHVYDSLPESSIFVLGNRKRPESMAQDLFGCLRNFDYLGVDIIFAEGVDEDGIGTAIMNRLKKAAAEEIKV